MPVAPIATIDETGIHAPDFATIQTFFQDAYRGIYGADVYLGNDSQDGQWVALIALALNDANAQTIAAYNAFSPSTAQGEGLSRVVKINGIRRKSPTRSSVDLRIIGQAGAVILGGQAQDESGTTWSLPDTVTIPLTGEITVTATATDLGAITARAGTITGIATPTFGWQSVTNPSAAAPGAPVETDAQLRARQTISTSLSSQTILQGLQGAVAAISGVTRAKIYENDTNSLDANGIPGHAIALVVLGGDTSQIAQVLALKKGNVGTYGSTLQGVTDSAGTQRNIAFFRPRAVQIQYVIEVRTLLGFSVNVIAAIQAAVSAWTNALDINEDVRRTRAFVPANLPDNPLTSTFEILTLRVARDGRIPKEQDIAIAFNEMAACDPSSVIVRPVAGPT